MNKRFIATTATFMCLLLVLMACDSTIPPGAADPYAYQAFTPSPVSVYNQDAQYSAAQATLNAGQNEIMDLSHQATVVSLGKDQAANAAAQATMDYNQRQLMELSIRGTEVSLKMAQAAATQQFITEQTQAVWNATATAQSQAATATYSTYIFSVTQTAHVQAILDVQATQTAQAKATWTAYSLTATPWAAFQADIVRTRNEAERRALWGEFVVTPLKVILLTLVVVLFIVGGVMAYQRLMPVLELRLRVVSRYNRSPLLLTDGMMVDPDAPYRPLTPEESLQANAPQISREALPVEIIGSSEPSVTNWVTEAEQKLRATGRAVQR